MLEATDNNVTFRKPEMKTRVPLGSPTFALKLMRRRFRMPTKGLV